MTADEHVPDRFSEFARQIDRGHLAPALGTEPLLDALVARAVMAGVGRLLGGFNESPAQIFGAVLGEGPAPIVLPGLADLGTQAGVAAELGGEANRLTSPSSAAMV